MFENRGYQDCRPITWVGKVPVYLATCIAAAHAVAMALTAIAMSIGGPVLMNRILEPLIFNPETVFRSGQIWQFVTYAFVNPPDIWAVLQIYLLAVFGAQVEQFVGRRAFGWFYAMLVIGVPVLLLALQLFGIESIYMGAGTANFAVFIAFALIYPAADVFFGLTAKWLAIILLALNSLQTLAASAWAMMAVLWWECAIAYMWMKWSGVRGFSVPGFSAVAEKFRRKPKLRVVRADEVAPARREPEVHESIDPILEKISKHGMASLTKSEKARLEKARAELIEKERPR